MTAQTTLGEHAENPNFLPRRVILIGGSARAAAQSAIAAGLRVAAIDMFGDQDLRAAVEDWRPWRPAEPLVDPIRSLLAAAPQLPTGIVLVGGGELAVERLAAARRQLAASPVRFLTPTPQQLRDATDPAGLQTIAHRSGIAFPAWRLDAPTDAERAHRWLIKPRDRCGGLTVREYQGPPSRETSATAASQPASYLQRFVPGQLLGVSYCADREATHCLGVCLGRSGGARGAPFRYAGSIGPVPLSAAWQTSLQRLGEVMRTTWGLRGLFGVDLICDGSDIFLLEVNLRYCASMELLDCEQLNCMAMHCLAFSSSQSSTLSLSSGETKSHDQHGEPPAAVVRCKRIVYARRRIVWDASKQFSLESFLRQQGVDSAAKPDITCRDLPCLGTVIDAGQPMLTIVTGGAAAATAWRRATAQSITIRSLLGA